MDGFQPEGIAIGAPFAYFGSRVDGDIYRASPRNPMIHRRAAVSRGRGAGGR